MYWCLKRIIAFFYEGEKFVNWYIRGRNIMISSMLICDNQGLPFYSKIVSKESKLNGEFQPELLSGLISAIGTIGKSLFNEEIATINFGTEKNGFKIVTYTKELFGQNRVIYFVFMTKGEIDQKLIKNLCTTIYMEAKNTLKEPSVDMNIKEKVDRIIDFKFNGLKME